MVFSAPDPAQGPQIPNLPIPDSASKTIEDRLNETIFLDLREINIIDLFKFIAEEGKLNVVTSKNVQGRSTLVLHNVKVRDALDILVISNQLAYELKGDIIYIMTEEEFTLSHGKSFNDKRKVLTRSLRYAKPSYAVSALQALQSSVGKVIVDEEMGKVVMIDTPEDLAQMDDLLNQIETKLNSQVIELQYAKAKDVEAQLKPQIEGKGVGTLFADERSNQIMVSAYPDRLKELVPMVEALDKATKAVLVEVKILQLELNPTFDSGIDWERAFRNERHKDLKNLDFRSTFPVVSSLDGATGTVGKIAIGKVDDDQFTVALKAVKQIQNSKVLANPRLMIADGQESKINIAERIPYIVTTTTGTGSNASVSEDIKFIDVGIILSVKPTINDKGLITMAIRPEISSESGSVTSEQTKNVIPKVTTTFIETTAIVQDGYTVILGGLRRDQFTEANKGVPYLMNMPLLGNLFKSRDESYKRTEIVILITPKITLGKETVVDEPIPIIKNVSTLREPYPIIDPNSLEMPQIKMAALTSFNQEMPPHGGDDTPWGVPIPIIKESPQMRKAAS